MIESKGNFIYMVCWHTALLRERAERGNKKEPNFLLPAVSNNDFPSVSVCANALQRLYCIGRKQWYQLATDASLPKQSPNPNYENNLNRQLPIVQDIVDYLHELGEIEGERYATRYVRMETRLMLRNSDLDQIELPSSFTKRSIYERFYYERG